MYNVLSCEHTVKYSLWRINSSQKTLVIPRPGSRTTQFSFLVIPWLDHGIQVICITSFSSSRRRPGSTAPQACSLSPRSPGPVFLSCHPAARDDKCLSFFILRFFSIVIPAQAGIHCAAGIYVVAPRHHICTLNSALCTQIFPLQWGGNPHKI